MIKFGMFTESIITWEKMTEINEIPLSNETTSEPAEYASSMFVHFSHTKSPLAPIPTTATCNGILRSPGTDISNSIA